MATFTKFDPRVFLVNERRRESLRAKPAKVAKAQSFQGDPPNGYMSTSLLGPRKLLGSIGHAHPPMCPCIVGRYS
jgi:hypothetical protein